MTAADWVKVAALSRRLNRDVQKTLRVVRGEIPAETIMSRKMKRRRSEQAAALKIAMATDAILAEHARVMAERKEVLRNMIKLHDQLQMLGGFARPNPLAARKAAKELVRDVELIHKLTAGVIT